MTALDFLELLEKQNLLSRKVLDKLRRQVESSPRSVSPQSLSRALVKKGLLRKDKAQQLLDQLSRREQVAIEQEDELGLAPDDDLPSVRPAPQRPAVSGTKTPSGRSEQPTPELPETDRGPEQPEPVFAELDDEAHDAELGHGEPVAEIDHDALSEPAEEESGGGAVRPRPRGLTDWFRGTRAPQSSRASIQRIDGIPL